MTRKLLISALFGCFAITGAIAQQPDAQVHAEISSPPDRANSSQGLQVLIEEALKKNPGVQSALKQVEAMRSRVLQAKTLPDPTIGIGWAGDITPFKVQRLDPSSYRGIIASQAIPYPGKLKLEGQIADREAESAWWDYESARRGVVAEVKSAYYQYSYAAKAIEVTQKDKDLLQKFSSIAEARYRVGKAIQQDVLKSQTEISLLQQKLTILEQERLTAQARLNTLLFRDPESSLAPEPLAQSKFDYSLEQLYQFARDHDTGLQREQRMVERNQYAMSLAKKGYRPDFSVSYMYQQRPALPDMHGFTLTANIPVFYRSKQREAVKEAANQLDGSQKSKDNRQTELLFAVKEQYLMVKASEQLLQLYSQAVVPQSSLTLESSLSSYQVGTADFLTILTNFQTVLDYEVDYYHELANYQTALARLEPLVGVELTK